MSPKYAKTHLRPSAMTKMCPTPGPIDGVRREKKGMGQGRHRRKGSVKALGVWTLLIATATTPMFWGSSNPLEFLGRLCNQTGKGKIQMVTSKLQMHVFPLADKTTTTFQRLYLRFRDPAVN